MKLMTLNINYDESTHGAWPVRRGLIADAIRAHGPDVIALQAIRRDPAVEDGLDQAKQLAALLPQFQHVAFQPALDHPDGRQDGSAFLSRIPFALTDSLRLKLVSGCQTEPPRDAIPRLLLTARLAQPALTLLNCHISWVYEQAVVQMEEVLTYAERELGPRVLLGDLNTTSELPLIERLRSKGWTDAWSFLRPGEAGHTFESHAPGKRIDYVWVSEDLRPALKSIEVVREEPNPQGARLSDHLGLAVALNA